MAGKSITLTVWVNLKEDVKPSKAAKAIDDALASTLGIEDWSIQDNDGNSLTYPAFDEADEDFEEEDED